jgi:hypothetical protein
VVSCERVSAVSCLNLRFIGRTKPLPSDFPQSLEVDLIFRVFEEIFFPRLTPN